MNIINGVYSEDYNQVGGCIMKNILFIASEGVPFIKTGGLADVVGSLPKGIDKEYYDVRVILRVCQTVWRNSQGIELQASLSVGTMCGLAEIKRTSWLAM